MVDQYLLVGELSLDGSIRPVRGALSVAVCARNQGIPNLVLPFDNAAEAAVVEGLNVFGMKHLAEVVAMLSRPQDFPPAQRTAERAAEPESTAADFREVRGQATAKRALKPGSGIGYHEQHEDEVYYVLSGHGVMTLDDKPVPIGPGTAVLTRPGSSHGLKQTGTEDLVVLISYEIK